MAQVEQGIGCRTLTIAASVLIGVAALEVAAGLWLSLSTPPIAERLGFTLYAAGAPVSAAFAAIAGELPLAPFTDVIVWMVIAALIGRSVERSGSHLWRPIGVTVVVSLLYGAGISSLIERVG